MAKKKETTFQKVTPATPAGKLGVGALIATLGVLGVSAGGLINASKSSDIETGFSIEDQAQNISLIPSLRTEQTNLKEDVKENAEKSEDDIKELGETQEANENRKLSEEREGDERVSELIRDFEKQELGTVIYYEDRIIDQTIQQQARYDLLQNTIITQNHSLLLLLIEGKIGDSQVVQEEFYNSLSE